MASLLDWLAYSGARKVDGTPVASGKAYFYTPGTTNTFATVYSDKDGLITAPSPVQLDASGRAEVYAKSIVHAEVYDAAGALVRLEDRANAVNAAQVEIENAGATGVDLVSGITVAGGRTDLNTFITNMLGSFGAPDGKVLVGGLPQSLAAVLAATTGVFFNVKSTAFGARGDLLTDDSAAIQSAINACVAAGGGTVYFPPGSYVMNSALVINSALVAFQGANPSTSFLFANAAATEIIAFGVSATDFTAFSLGFVTASSTSKLFTGGSSRRFLNCSFQQTSSAVAITISAGRTQSYTACTFLHQGTGAFFSSSTSSTIEIVGGEIAQSATASPGLFFTGSAGNLIASSVNITVTGGPTTYQVVGAVAAISSVFTGCHLLPSIGNTLNLGPLTGTTPTIVDAGNLIEASGVGTTNIGIGAGVSVLRETRGLRTTGSAITYTPDVQTYKWHDVTSSGASFVFANPANIPSNASRIELHLRYKNISGGAITPTFGANYRIGAAPSVANNAYAAWIFEYAVTDAVWVQSGANPISITA